MTSQPSGLTVDSPLFYTFVHMKQLSLFKKDEMAYGGDLLKKRKGRMHGRPLAVKRTMHVVLKSSLAKGEWSFRRHKKAIASILEKFAARGGIRLISVANVGNHIHIHLKLGNRRTYAPFIRAITSAIAMKVTGRSRWNKIEGVKFWDRRPFSRIVIGRRGYLTMQDYLRINKYEGDTGNRRLAEYFVRRLRFAGSG